MRDRLSNMIQNAVNGCAKYWADVIADHLLAEGVIVPQMALGQTCYKLCAYRNDIIDECRVSSITQKADGTFKIRLTNLSSRFVFEITPKEIGKTVFLTREEAEKALKGANYGKAE